jgi:outer membrane protein assembly factor BamE (lipoprotein component of BamABCDE complex)
MSAVKSAQRVAVAASCLCILSTSALALDAKSSAPTFSRSIIVTHAPRVNDAVMARVAPGMSRDEITTLIGSPERTVRFALSKTTAWDYDFVDTWGYASVFSVLFDDGGAVVGKVATRNDY